MESKTITFGKTGTRPYGVLTVTETAVDNVNNTSTVSISLVLKRPRVYTSTLTKHASCTINGTTYDWSGKIGGGTTDLTLISKTQTIKHNNDGSKTINMSAEIELKLQWGDVYLDTISGSGSMSLTKLSLVPTSAQSVKSKTETTIVMKWSSNSTVDRIWYSLNGGSTWNAASYSGTINGQYSISGLAANTTYQIRTRVRRKDSQQTGDSSIISVSTYAYPHCTKVPTFVIGNSVKIELYNPLSRTVIVDMIGNDNSIIKSVSTSGTSISGYNDGESVENLYRSILNSALGSYKIKVVYGSNTSTKPDGVYQVNAALCSPIVSNAEYQDVNASVVAITGDPSKIVQGRSVVRYSATVGAKNGASVASCKVIVNDQTINLAVSGTSASGGNAPINSSIDVTARIMVTDSRGLSSYQDIAVTMLSWETPTAIIDMQRLNNYYSQTNITVDARYSYVDGTNAIEIKYRKKKTEDSIWESYILISDNVQETFNADNEFEWDVEVVLTDSYGGSRTYRLKLPIGMPIIYFDNKKSSVGIGCFPSEEKSLELVGGSDRVIIKKDSLKLSNGTYEKTIAADGPSTTASSGTVTIATGTYKTVGTINFPVGVYLIEVNARFPQNTTGRRVVLLSASQDSGNPPTEMYLDTRNAIIGTYTNCKFTAVRKFSSPTTMYINAYQNSGGDLDVYYRCNYTRLA